ncbi:interferon-related developmental regulator-domain-containing protein [Radiomyces spectabilis]|uniref:interferon-related developmental regulator-domain-containing protein n=1 Tax=Radiomyces spectabilis TaxID=64574 RepID=UPI002220A613|nr:interferon-related developmental regulator-domain-containing protein [Radiomyces spectabilis]KAI8371557.1 interferon-related developmental regulator-domain-containing protein [Radiomyces spectabilis]
MPTQTSKRHSEKGAASRTGEVDIANASWKDKLHQAIDNLAESRTSTREEALSLVIALLTRHYAADTLESRNEELLLALRRSLCKAHSVQEACLASKAIALTFIQHGDISMGEQEEYLQLVLPALKATVRNSESSEIKVHCMQTMALVIFIAASDIDKQLIRDFIFDFIETEGEAFSVDDLSSNAMDQLMCAAAKAYGLLFIASFCEGAVDIEILWEEMERVMPVHEILLESPDKNVRSAAGENIALIFETLRVMTEDEEEEADEEDAMEKREYDNMDELIHTLRDLSVDSNRRRNKSDRAEQRSLFRDVVRSVEEGERPVEELKIHGRTIPFRGWSKLLPLNTFRSIMGQGLQFHFKTNNLFRQIFHYSMPMSFSSYRDDSDDEEPDHVDPSQISNADKHYIYSESKKLRSKRLRNARIARDKSQL